MDDEREEEEKREGIGKEDDLQKGWQKEGGRKGNKQLQTSHQQVQPLLIPYHTCVYRGGQVFEGQVMSGSPGGMWYDGSVACLGRQIDRCYGLLKGWRVGEYVLVGRENGVDGACLLWLRG